MADNGTPGVKTDDTFTNWTTSDGLAHNFVRDIAFEGARIVWIATDGGLARLDHGGTPTNKSDDVFTTFRMSDGLPAQIAYGVTVDGSGRKWVAAHTGSAGAGIGVLSDNGTAAKTDDVWVVINTADGLPYDAVEDVVIASPTAMWIATPRGLVHFDHKGTLATGSDDQVSVINAATGLPSDAVQAIAVEAPNRIAVGTHDAVYGGLGRVFLP